MANSKPLIEFNEIRKSFGPVEVLHGVSFSLPPARILGLVGENGSGLRMRLTLRNRLSYSEDGCLSSR
jgi:ABC-type sugar transport system ATPase subunit